MSLALIDADEALRHLRLLDHAPWGVTQVQIERKFPGAVAEDRTKRSGTPERWTGVYAPENYDRLLHDLEEFDRFHRAIVFNIYVGTNPRTVEAVPYADHKIRSFPEIKSDRRQPQYVNQGMVIQTNTYLDLDFVRSGRDRGTTAKQKEQVVQVAHQILESESPLRQGDLFDTGNNCAILGRLPRPTPHPKEVFAAYHEQLRRQYDLHRDSPTAIVKLDPSSDAFHIMGLAGTLKYKGTTSGRMQFILHEGAVCHDLERKLSEISAEIAVCLIHGREKARHGPIPEVGRTTISSSEIEAAIAGWCDGYRDIWDEADVFDRSQALFAIALKMLADGWEPGQVVRALEEWCARRVYHRSPRWFDRLVSDASAKLQRGVRPSHRTVERVLGRCTCGGSCDVERAARAKIIPEVEWDSLQYPPMDKAAATGADLKDAREDQVHFGALAIQEALADERVAWLFTGPPGIGKTHAIREQTRHIRTLYLTDRKEEFSKFHLKQQRGDCRLQEIHRRSECCERPSEKKRIEDLETAGLGRHGQRVCDQCADNGKCAYHRQFHPRRGGSFVAASSYVATGRFREIVRQVDLVVCDEDLLHAALPEVGLQRTTILRLREVALAMGEAGRSLLPTLDVIDSVLGLPRQNWSELLRGARSVADAVRATEAHHQFPHGLDWSALKKREGRTVESWPPERLTPVSLVHLAEVVWRLISSTSTPCRLYAKGQGSQRELRLVRFQPIEINKPVLVLDATGQPRLYQELFPGHEVKVDPAHCRVEGRIVQVCDQRLPLQTLRSESKRKQIRALVQSIVRAREKEHGQGVLVIARQEVLPWLELPGTVLSTHYGRQRGSRAFEQCHSAILVGVPEPPPEQVAIQAEVLLGAPVSRERVCMLRPYQVESEPGKSFAAEVTVYRDTLHQALLERVREGELIQATFRIRPLNESAGHKQVYILTSVPLELVVPDDLLTLDELCSRFGAGQRLVDRVRRLRQEHPDMSQAEVARQLKVSRQAVSKALARGSGSRES